MIFVLFEELFYIENLSTRQKSCRPTKFALFDSQVVHDISKHIKSMAKQALCPPSTCFDRHRLLLMLPFTQQQTPTEGESQQAEQFADAFQLCQMRVFEVETTTFHTAKQRFNLPSLGIVIQGGVWGIPQTRRG